MTTATLEKPRTRPKLRFTKAGDPILPNGYEFVNGKLVEGAVSELSAWVSRKLNFHLDLWILDKPIGLFFTGTSEQGFQCFPFLPKQVRRPDAAFVRRDMTGQFLLTDGFTKDVPEFIAEVISPGDRIYALDEKLDEFLRAGTKLIWVINPIRRTARIIHADGVAYPIREDGVLDGEDVLPGLIIPLSSILPPKVD